MLKFQIIFLVWDKWWVNLIKEVVLKQKDEFDKLINPHRKPKFSKILILLFRHWQLNIHNFSILPWKLVKYDVRICSSRFFGSTTSWSNVAGFSKFFLFNILHLFEGFSILSSKTLSWNLRKHLYSKTKNSTFMAFLQLLQNRKSYWIRDSWPFSGSKYPICQKYPIFLDCSKLKVNFLFFSKEICDENRYH